MMIQCWLCTQFFRFEYHIEIQLKNFSVVNRVRVTNFIDKLIIIFKHFLENDVKAIHEILLKNQSKLIERFSTLPGAYKVQMLNALDHLCDLNAHDYVIKP